MFKIKDQQFNIKYAYLDAFVDKEENQLVFGLQIQAEDNNDLFDGYDLDLNSEVLLRINPNELKKWQDIAGKTIEWTDYPEDESEPHALFYVFEHEGVRNTKVEFKNVEDKMMVKISALIDIYANDDFSENLPLEIETEIEFFGILCGKDTTEEACRNRIKPYLDLDNLMFVQNKYNVSVMVPKETDMQTNRLVLGEY